MGVLRGLRRAFSIEALARRLGSSRAVELAALPLWTLDPMGANFDDVEPARSFVASRPVSGPARPERLRVMTWNIKYGGGRVDFFYDGHGDRVLMSAPEVRSHLQGLAAKIREVDPDVLMLQEVDVRSRRAAFLDQMRWLLEHTDLSWGVYASQWRVRHVPSRGLGQVDAGVGILARYPLRQAERISLPLLTHQDPFTQYFFLRRCLLRARLEVPGFASVWFVNTHQSAFVSGVERARQLRALRRVVDGLDEAGERVVFGGDFNMLPPGSARVSGFEDEAPANEEIFLATDYAGGAEALAPLYERYRAAVPRQDFARDNAAHFTYSAREDVFWNRKLDYLFTNGRWSQGGVITHQGPGESVATMPLSDHAPLSAELALS